MLHGTEDSLINQVNHLIFSQLTLVHYTEELAPITYLAAMFCSIAYLATNPALAHRCG